MATRPHRYGPEADSLRQELEEIEVRRRVREAVTAQLAAMAVPAGKRKAPSAKRVTEAASDNTAEKASPETDKLKISDPQVKKGSPATEPGDEDRFFLFKGMLFQIVKMGGVVKESNRHMIWEV